MTAEIAMVGAGFAGSILARILALQGHRVYLIDRAIHPRFALGESATPLAALSLERLAARWRLDDLDALAAYGRWNRRLPKLGHGLKRGFTFYGHTPGHRFANGAEDDHRLLVAASHRDEIADSHWLRADVDTFLIARAGEAGVEVLDGTDISSVERSEGGGFELTIRSHSSPVRAIRSSHVLDASGRGGVLAAQLTEARRIEPALRTSLVGSHFEGVHSWVTTAGRDAAFEPGPYPEERAAIHHLLGDAWLYVLPFDDGRASAGLVSRGTVAPAGELKELLTPYPTLAACFADARRCGPAVRLDRVAYRSTTAAGENWAMLPSSFAFDDPMFSTGIAWSLVAVERLAVWGLALAEGRVGEADDSLASYGRLLEREADHVSSLVGLAWDSLASFDAFVAVAQLYFAAASFCEAQQRLCDDVDFRSGFLGATDSVIQHWPERARERLSPAALLDLIEERNIAGLGDESFGRRIPASIEHLIAASAKLGLTRPEARSRLGRLRGFDKLYEPLVRHHEN
ncbi:MAG: hypothetical protein VYE73_15400 [Acidobacteriota bacterium]|nr:hypothetical protein [Acidobacteriota bacterium]